MARLVFFAGHAGTGKTTLARHAVPLLHARTGESFCVLDKDTVYGAYSAKVMGLLTGDPDDRDSPVYLENLRDQEYCGLLEIAAENLRLGVNVVLVGPFSREVKARGFARDRYKLQHWNEYRKRRFDPDPAEFPALLRFDNTVFDEAAFERLIDAIA
jgi:predicted kinase